MVSHHIKTTHSADILFLFHNSSFLLSLYCQNLAIESTEKFWKSISYKFSAFLSLSTCVLCNKFIKPCFLAKIFNLFNLRNLCAIFGCGFATLWTLWLYPLSYPVHPLPNPSHQGRGKTFPPLDGGGQVRVLNCSLYPPSLVEFKICLEDKEMTLLQTDQKDSLS